MKDIVELITKLEDRVLAQENYKDAVAEAEKKHNLASDTFKLDFGTELFSLA